MKRLFALAGLAGALACLSSCFAITDLDRFQKNSGKYVDLSFTVRGMKSHVAEYFEYRVVDADNRIQSRGIALPLGGVDASFFAPRAVPTDKQPVRVDFFADHDGKPGYTPDDHSWRVPIDLSTVGAAGVVIAFDHNTSFTALGDATPVGSAARIHFKNLDGQANRRLEVRAADTFTGRVVALYRVPVVQPATKALDVEVPGVIDTDNSYTVEITSDDPNVAGSLVGWRLQQDSTKNGLDVTFDPSAADALRVGDPSPP